jgi:hypothetical protein
MGVEIKLSDKDVPVSPSLIEFLHHRIRGTSARASWHDQLDETLVPAEFEERVQQAEAVADEVLQHPLGQQVILRAYELFTALLVGRVEALAALQSRMRFICVIGCPRHGGTYLTKALFSALGFDPLAVPNAIAHDGFPDAAPFALAARHNGYTTMMLQTAEYLAMAETFFGAQAGQCVAVPKKATKAVYHGAFFASVFGPQTHCVFTLRHPVAACISTYEKSNGLPASGNFAVRGNIEEWASRDNIAAGADPQRITERDYFDVYLRYWEHYHHQLAVSGLAAIRSRTMVVYGSERLKRCAAALCEPLGPPVALEEFREPDYGGRHRDWDRRAEPAIRRIAQVWHDSGLAFPLDELMERR